MFADYAATSEDNTRYFTNNNEHFICGSSPLTQAWPSSAQNDPASNGWQEGLQCMGMYAARVITNHDPDATRRDASITDYDFSITEFTRGWPQWGYELVSGQWLSFFVISRDIDPAERGAQVPASSYDDVTRFCDGTDTLRTSGALWGPQTGHNGGIPQFQRGSDTWNRWSCALIILANQYHPGDVDVQAAITERLINNPIYVSGSTRRSELTSVPDNSINFFSMIPQAFTWPQEAMGDPDPQDLSFSGATVGQGVVAGGLLPTFPMSGVTVATFGTEDAEMDAFDFNAAMNGTTVGTGQSLAALMSVVVTNASFDGSIIGTGQLADANFGDRLSFSGVIEAMGTAPAADMQFSENDPDETPQTQAATNARAGSASNARSVSIIRVGNRYIRTSGSPLRRGNRRQFTDDIIDRLPRGE